MRVAILTRQLTKQSPTIVTRIIHEPNQHRLSQMDAYNEQTHFTEEAEKDVKAFCAVLPEFREAKWEISILDDTISEISHNVDVLTIRSR